MKNYTQIIQNIKSALSKLEYNISCDDVRYHLNQALNILSKKNKLVGKKNDIVEETHKRGIETNKRWLEFLDKIKDTEKK